MADIKQLGIQVKADGLQATLNKIDKLSKSAQSVVEPIRNMQRVLMLSNDIDMTKTNNGLGKVLEITKSLVENLKAVSSTGNGFKGISGSFTSIATAAEKLATSAPGIAQFNTQLAAVKTNLEGIKDVSGSLRSIKIGTTSTRAPTASTVRSAVSNADLQTNEAFTASQKRLIAQLEREALQVGKTRGEYLEARAAKLGMADAAAPYIATLRAAETQGVRTGISQKQLAQAMRMVPAQFTDIAAQLAGGQSPFLIMIQQGGQLRDMFGGFGAMFKNVGSMLLKFLVNPYVLAAEAIAGVVTAMYMATKETTTFQKSLDLTNNYVGMSKDKFRDLQVSLAAIGYSKSQVSDALNAIAASGKITGGNIEGLTKSVIDFSNKSGIAIEEVVKEYASLAQDPVQAMLTLDSKYNFLTASVYEHIKSLVAQGEKTKAVKYAQDELTKAHADMTRNLTQNAGWVEKAWDGVLKKFRAVKDFILDIGRGQTLSEKAADLAVINKQLDRIKAGDAKYIRILGDGSRLKQKKQELETELGIADQKQKAIAATSAKVQQDKIDRQTLEAADSIYSSHEKKVGNIVAMKREMAKVDAAAAVAQASGNKDLMDKYSKDNVKKIKDAIKEEYTPKEKGGSVNTELAQIVAQTNALRAETAQLNRLGLTYDKVGEATKKVNALEYERKLTGTTSKRKKEIEEQLPALRNLAQAENENRKAKETWNEAKKLQEKGQALDALITSQKEEIKLLENESTGVGKVSEHEKQAAMYRAEAIRATNLQVKALAESRAAQEDEAEVLDKKIKQLNQLKQLREQGTKRTETGGIELTDLKEKLSMGDVTDSQKLTRQTQTEEMKKIAELNSQLRTQQRSGSEEAVKEIQNQINAEKDLMEQKLAAIKQYDDQKGSFEDMVNSSKRAWADFIGSSKSTEQDMHSLFSESFSTMASSLESFCTTGKLNFKSMSLSIIKNIESIIVKWLAWQAVQGIASLAMSSTSASTGSFESAGVGVGDMSSYGLSTVEAKGDAFTSSGISKFAKGGAFTNNIISQPTIFKYAKGQSFGLMGEAGPEAIMPLARTSTGSLGVKVAGESGGSSDVFNINVNVQQDGNSSVDSKGTGASEAKKTGELLAQKIREVILTERRPGGILA